MNFMNVMMLFVGVVYPALTFAPLQKNFQILTQTINNNQNSFIQTFTRTRPQKFLNQYMKVFITIYSFNFQNRGSFQFRLTAQPVVRNDSANFDLRFSTNFNAQVGIYILLTDHYGVQISNIRTVTNGDTMIGVTSNGRSATKSVYGIVGFEYTFGATLNFTTVNNVLRVTSGTVTLYTKTMRLNTTLDFYGVYRYHINTINQVSLNNTRNTFSYSPNYTHKTLGQSGTTVQIAWITSFYATTSQNIFMNISGGTQRTVTVPIIGNQFNNYTGFAMTFVQLKCGANEFLAPDQESCISGGSTSESKNNACIGLNGVSQKIYIQEYNYCYCLNGLFYNNCSCHYSCGHCIRKCQQCSRFRTSPNTHTCSCMEGYFDDGANQTCAPCFYSCKSCSNSNSCNSCPGTRNTLNTTSPYCHCADGYYQQPRQKFNQCGKCHIYCKTCNGFTFKKCLSCQSTNFRSLNNTLKQCKCNNGYYPVSNQAKCQKCHYSCLTCSSLSKCLSCNTTLNRKTVSAGTCQCLDNFYQKGNQKACSTCSKYTSQCTKCGKVGNCLQCDTANHWKLSTYGCVCDPGYYLNVNTCTICNQTCKQCSDANTCTKCNANTILSSGNCDCYPSFYFNTSTNSCQLCNYTCRTCSQANTNLCLSCPTQFFRQFVGGNCPCKSKYYNNGTNKQCDRCHYSCFNCSNQGRSNCLSCNTTNKRINPPINGTCSCNDQYFDIGQAMCVKCSLHCKKCTSQSNCSECNGGFTLKDKYCICVNKTYDDGSSCASCHHSCANCTSSEFTKCTKCPTSSQRTFFQGKCRCNPGFFDNNNNQICSSCNKTSNPFCQTCQNSQDNCTSCNKRQFRQLKNNQCPCINGYYQNSSDQVCLKCDHKCKTCLTTNQNCITCDLSNFRTKDGNDCPCIDGYYNLQPFPRCFICHYTCKTCNTQNNSACLSCPTQSTFNRQLIVINSSVSKCNCKQFYYDDGKYTKCRKCHYSCQTCQQIRVCKTCNITNNRMFESISKLCQCAINYYDNEDLSAKCEKCHYSCQNCDKFKCLTCNKDDGRVSRQLISCPCKQGTFDDGKNNSLCLPCDVNCLGCSGTSNTCKNCKNSKMLINPQTKYCQCLLGYYYDNNKLDCKICTVPFCKRCSQKNYCQQCSSGLYQKDNQTCQLVCKPDQYYEAQKDRCLPYCKQFYYFNTKLLKCVKDSSGTKRQHAFLFSLSTYQDFSDKNQVKIHVKVKFTLKPIKFKDQIQNVLNIYHKFDKVNYSVVKQNQTLGEIQLAVTPKDTKLNENIYVVFKKDKVVYNQTLILQKGREYIRVVNGLSQKDTFTRNALSIVFQVMGFIVFILLLIPMPFTNIQQIYYLSFIIAYTAVKETPYTLPITQPSILGKYITTNSLAPIYIQVGIVLFSQVVLNRILKRLPFARVIILVEINKTLFNVFYIMAIPVLFVFFDNLTRIGSSENMIMAYTVFIPASLISLGLIYMTVITNSQLLQDVSVDAPFHQNNSGIEYAYGYIRIIRMLLICISGLLNGPNRLVLIFVVNCVYGVSINMRVSWKVEEYIRLVLLLLLNIGAWVLLKFTIRRGLDIFGYCLWGFFMANYLIALSMDLYRVVSFLRRYTSLSNQVLDSSIKMVRK